MNSPPSLGWKIMRAQMAMKTTLEIGGRQTWAI
jgi:hypothetical protein